MHEYEKELELLFVSGKSYDWTDCYEKIQAALNKFMVSVYVQ